MVSSLALNPFSRSNRAQRSKAREGAGFVKVLDKAAKSHSLSKVQDAFSNRSARVRTGPKSLPQFAFVQLSSFELVQLSRLRVRDAVKADKSWHKVYFSTHDTAYAASS